MTEENLDLLRQAEEPETERTEQPAPAPEDAAPAPAAQREESSWYASPETAQPHREENVDVWKEAAKKERRHRRVLGWCLAVCLLAALGCLVAFVIWPAVFPKRTENGPTQPEEGDNASSIVDIFGHKETTIPRVKGDPAVRLTVSSQRGEELTAVEIYAKVNPSVVTVVSEESNGASVGTGIIMTSDGYIITNAHVISGGKSCWIALDTGVQYDALLVGFDEDEDLAVLKAVDAKDLPVAEFGDSDLLQVGERAYAIGNPLGVELRGTFTDGMISAVNRQIEVDGGQMTVIQTTAALNNGNSGGPLINSSGQVIGINTLKMSGSGWDGAATIEGLGFALPTSSVCFVVNDLIAKGEFEGTPTIGISVVTSQAEEGDGTQVVVYSVEPGLGAEKAGVRPGDVILEADGMPVTQTSDLLAVRRNHVIGDMLRLRLRRGTQVLEVEVELYSSKAVN